MPRLKNSDYPNKDEHETNPAGFEVAIMEKTEQRVGDKNEPNDRGEQNQGEKVVHVTVSHEAHIEQRTGNQGATLNRHVIVKRRIFRLMRSTYGPGSMRPSLGPARHNEATRRCVRKSDLLCLGLEVV